MIDDTAVFIGFNAVDGDEGASQIFGGFLHPAE